MRTTTTAILLLSSLLLPVACFGQWTGAPKGGRGYLCNPPLYVNNEPDFPLTAFAVLNPSPGEFSPDVDVSRLRSDHWNVNGNNVQPGLDLRMSWVRVSLMRGFLGGWSAGLSVPWYRNKVQGQIGGLTAEGVAEGLGNISLIGKKTLWQDCKTGRRVDAAFGIELPTGPNSESFGQQNLVTSGYFATGHRIPLGWQPSTGTFNGLMSVDYSRTMGRLAWQVLAAAKFYGTDGEDVKVGNVFLGEMNATYGISKAMAGSLGFTFRDQADDDYPNSPLPVNGSELQGTTNHSLIIYLDAALRYSIAHKVTVGVGIRTPINNPDAGMDPTGEVSIIFYPDTNE